MTARLGRLRERVAAEGWEALALVPGPNFYYATGAPLHASERLNLLVIPPDRDPVALAPALEAPFLRPLGIEIHEWRDEEGPAPALARMVAALGLDRGTLAVEYAVMRYGEAARLREAAPGLKLVRGDEAIAALRAVKGPEEIAAIRRAIALTEAALNRVIARIRAGQSEREIAGMLRVEMLERGADAVAFAHVVAGPRSAEPHAGPSDRAVEPGDVIIIDCGATLDHYSGDITRCVALEPVPEEIIEIHALCLEANRAGRAAVRPGATGHEIDHAARDVIVRGGRGEYFIHRTGHGLGLEIHEPPYIVAGNHEPLIPGNVFTVEPGIYLPGIGGVRIEDNLHVTGDGGESLTTFARELVRV